MALAHPDSSRDLTGAVEAHTRDYADRAGAERNLRTSGVAVCEAVIDDLRIASDFTAIEIGRDPVHGSARAPLINRPNSGYFVAKRAPNELTQIIATAQVPIVELLATTSLERPCEQAPDADHRTCA